MGQYSNPILVWDAPDYHRFSGSTTVGIIPFTAARIDRIVIEIFSGHPSPVVAPGEVPPPIGSGSYLLGMTGQVGVNILPTYNTRTSERIWDFNISFTGGLVSGSNQRVPDGPLTASGHIDVDRRPGLTGYGERIPLPSLRMFCNTSGSFPRHVVYVHPTGNDAANGSTSGLAFRSIERAIGRLYTGQSGQIQPAQWDATDGQILLMTGTHFMSGMLAAASHSGSAASGYIQITRDPNASKDLVIFSGITDYANNRTPLIPEKLWFYDITISGNLAGVTGHNRVLLSGVVTSGSALGYGMSGDGSALLLDSCTVYLGNTNLLSGNYTNQVLGAKRVSRNLVGVVPGWHNVYIESCTFSGQNDTAVEAATLVKDSKFHRIAESPIAYTKAIVNVEANYVKTGASRNYSAVIPLSGLEPTLIYGYKLWDFVASANTVALSFTGFDNTTSGARIRLEPLAVVNLCARTASGSLYGNILSGTTLVTGQSGLMYKELVLLHNTFNWGSVAIQGDSSMIDELTMRNNTFYFLHNDPIFVSGNRISDVYNNHFHVGQAFGFQSQVGTPYFLDMETPLDTFIEPDMRPSGVLGSVSGAPSGANPLWQFGRRIECFELPYEDAVFNLSAGTMSGRPNIGAWGYVAQNPTGPQTIEFGNRTIPSIKGTPPGRRGRR